MSIFDGLSLRVRLLLAPVVCLILLAVCAAGALWGFSKQQAALTSISQSRLPSYSFSSRFESTIRDMNTAINRSLGYQSMGYSEQEIAVIDSELARLTSAAREMLAVREKDATDSQEKETLAALSSSFSKYEKAVGDTLDMKSGGPAIASSFLTTAQKEYSTLQDMARGLSESKLEASRLDVVQAGNDAKSAQTIVGVTTFAALVVGIALSVWVSYGLARRLKDVSSAMQSLAAGDLTQELQVHGADEVGQLLMSAEVVRKKLSDAILSVRRASESVSIASAEIAQGNNNLSERTEHQASSLEETAASIEELSETVKQNADAARQANQLAASASLVAIKGGQVVGQVVETMKGISESSRKMSEIIGVIDGIAFQTNILALNAAVEAARAGEQGRGFAVVASEVRSLASRSAEAAREIKILIHSSVERVEQGTELVDDAGGTMKDVVSSIRRVSDIMSEISAASNEQASSVAQVSEAVQSMDQVTQQNAALVEQMAAAATSLKSQAEDLVQAIATFKLGEDESYSELVQSRHLNSLPMVANASRHFARVGNSVRTYS